MNNCTPASYVNITASPLAFSHIDYCPVLTHHNHNMLLAFKTVFYFISDIQYTNKVSYVQEEMAGETWPDCQCIEDLNEDRIGSFEVNESRNL